MLCEDRQFDRCKQRLHFCLGGFIEDLPFRLDGILGNVLQCRFQSVRRLGCATCISLAVSSVSSCPEDDYGSWSRDWHRGFPTKKCGKTRLLLR